MITKKFEIDKYNGDCFTLKATYIMGEDFDNLLLELGKIYCKTHNNGWTICGEIHDDHLQWIDEFEAHHPILGKVWGSFEEEEVYADSEEGYEHFYKNFPPNKWNYVDDVQNFFFKYM